VTETCPACNADLRGEPIPEKYRHHNVPGDPYFNPKDRTCEEQRASWASRYPGEDRCFCLPYGDSTHFKRTIMVEIRGVYDGGLFLVCPDCGHAWHRFTDPRMMAKAQPYIDKHNAERNE
jgi:hypothetical protein